MYKKSCVAIACLTFLPALGHDTLVEFKAAYFLPTNDTFKDIYHGGAMYGPEVTTKIYKKLYGFASVDFFNKHGKSIGLCSPTRVSLIEIGLGLKYFFPWTYADFYLGLGVLPTRLHTHDESPYVTPFFTKWTCGGIAKLGAYIHLPKAFFLDVFFDYSFASVKPTCCPNSPTQKHTAHLNGCLFGAGIGYRFD